VPGPDTSERRFGSDDGRADPQVAAALAAFAAGSGSEHAALTSLAGSRLLVPLVAALAEEITGHRAAQSTEKPTSTTQNAPPAHCGTGSLTRQAGGGEKTSEVALPTLIGKDGRRAVPAFTSLDALSRWRPGARLVPTQAGLVWRAAIEDSCAVVIDVAGPVPVAIEGARLAALARGEPVPLPHEDPDVHDAVAKIAAQQPGIASVGLRPGDAGTDLVIQLALPGRGSASASELAAQVGDGIMALLGGRLRRGIAVVISPEAGEASGAVARPPAADRQAAGPEQSADPEQSAGPESVDPEQSAGLESADPEQSQAADR
jgi:hypothetical protein